jgi:hypothetical protein
MKPFVRCGTILGNIFRRTEYHFNLDFDKRFFRFIALVLHENWIMGAVLGFGIGLLLAWVWITK